MAKTIKNPKKGFTIIEVVLVLAIAGLIFLMVFVALPALQRMQRNTQRKNDLARFVAAVVDYQARNNGRMPDLHGHPGRFINRYIDSTCDAGATFLAQYRIDNNDDCTGDQFRDPLGNLYSFLYFRELDSPPAGQAAIVRCLGDVCNGRVSWGSGYNRAQEVNNGVIMVVSSAVCGATEGSVFGTGSIRDVAMLMILEPNIITCASTGTNINRAPPAGSRTIDFYRERSG